MAPHSSALAWKILWTEEPGRLQTMGSLLATGATSPSQLPQPALPPAPCPTSPRAHFQVLIPTFPSQGPSR